MLSQSAWFVGVLWLLRWESIFELRLILQILPVLLIPLQVIFNNFAEEILSWIGGWFRNGISYRDSSAHPSWSHTNIASCVSLVAWWAPNN